MPQEENQINIAEWRIARGLSQSQFADLLPVNLRTLQEWEAGRGKGRPPLFLWRALEHLSKELARARKKKT